jgi:hypothetical protein
MERSWDSAASVISARPSKPPGCGSKTRGHQRANAPAPGRPLDGSLV